MRSQKKNEVIQVRCVELTLKVNDNKQQERWSRETEKFFTETAEIREKKTPKRRGNVWHSDAQLRQLSIIHFKQVATSDE